MRTRHNAVIAVGTLVAVTALVSWLPLMADQGSNRPTKVSGLAEAAEGALKATIASHEAGKATIEDIYQWSRRLMSAEQQDAKADAASKHAERMKKLYERTEALYKNGAVGGSEREYYSTKYFMLESQASAAK